MVGFKNLPSLKKWVIENKYYLKSDNKVDIPTHFLLDGGRWNIPLNEYSNFLRLLATDLQNGEKYYLCENKTNIFRFMCDLDFLDFEEISLNVVEDIVIIFNNIIKEYFYNNNNNNNNEFLVIICGTETKKINDKIKTGYHLIWPKLWITRENAKKLRNLFVSTVSTVSNQVIPGITCNWEDIIDSSIYDKNGLRMCGCRKIVLCKECKKGNNTNEIICIKCDNTRKIDEGRVYKPYSIIDLNGNKEKYLIKLNDISTDFYLLLLETSIINFNNFKENVLSKQLPELLVSLPKRKTMVKENNGNLITNSEEINKKIETFIRKKFPSCYSKVSIKKVNKTDNIIFAIPNDNFCMNVNRNHSSSGIYFQIKPSGITQRCYCVNNCTEGRLDGLCKNYFSKEYELSKPLCNYLFGSINNNKKLTNYTNYSTKNINNIPIKNMNTNTSIIKSCKLFLEQLKLI